MEGEKKDRASMLARMQELESQVITANEAEIKVKHPSSHIIPRKPYTVHHTPDTVQHQA
jgi:hypothetical protein